MARSRKYNSYRGRGSRGKIVLAILLVLVILAAGVVILLQRNIVYDEDGLPHLVVPWAEEAAGETPPEPVLDLEIQTLPEEAPSLSELHGFRIPAGPLSRERYDSALAAMGTEYNAVAVVLKDESGAVYFDTAAAGAHRVETAEDTADALTALIDSEFRAIAEISCFRDPNAANADVEGMGLKNTGGYIFYDGGNHQWLDPAKPAARQYVCQLAVEAAELGFDELLLTHVSYPTVGKLDKIAYGETAKSENLKLFLEELRSALEPYGVMVTVEVSAGVITAGADEVSGQVLADIAAFADRVCVAADGAGAAALSAALTAAEEPVSLVALTAGYDPARTGSWLVTG